MGILNNVAVPSRGLGAKGLAQALLKTEVTDVANQVFQSMVTAYYTQIERIFSHPQLTPQEALDAFGLDAAELVTLAGLLKTAINTAKPGLIGDLPAVLIPNKDGTVSLGGQ